MYRNLSYVGIEESTCTVNFVFVHYNTSNIRYQPSPFGVVCILQCNINPLLQFWQLLYPSDCRCGGVSFLVFVAQGALYNFHSVVGEVRVERTDLQV
jgi:hypothetical protein